MLTRGQAIVITMRLFSIAIGGLVVPKARRAQPTVLRHGLPGCVWSVLVAWKLMPNGGLCKWEGEAKFSGFQPKACAPHSYAAGLKRWKAPSKSGAGKC